MKKPPRTISGKAFREPGIWETIREVLLGARRPLDCIKVEVTSRCPGRCIYCPHTTMGDRWHSRDMDMETFALQVWPLMRRSARVHLQGWGEPLLNPAFFDMAAFEEARRFAREALAKAEESGSSWFLYAAHLASGKALAADQEETGQAAEKHLQEALALATRMRSLPFLAHAAIELGEVLLRGSNSSDGTSHRKVYTQAREYGQQAVALGEQLRIPAVVERGRKLLIAVSRRSQ